MAILDLPIQATSFIGRTQELTDIAVQLNDPACRLLTLVGPGGMGKTRLAIEAARHVAETASPPFANGVHFVDLQPVSTGNVLVTTLANSLNVVLSGSQDLREQLLFYLSSVETLLILDNFEQLLAEVGLLADILTSALRVKLLVTSREALNLQEEWLWRVPGLPVPDQNPGTRFESYSAVELFAERARRAQQDFTLVGQETSVTKICQLVDGMPLALELAAAWTKALSCAEIAQEIQRGLDFLTTNRRNTPERHRSMQAVFDHSWRLLTEAERAVFPRLSVFRSGFRREAAEQVAEASLSVLAGLVDKSFLRLNPSGRYEIHELMRQYGEEQLDALEDTQNRHCAYFATFLNQRKLPLRGPTAGVVLDEIEAEQDNLRVSWEWAVEHGLIQEIHQSMHSLYLFCAIRSQAIECGRLFDLAIQRFQQDDSATLAYLLLAQPILSWFNGRKNDHNLFLRAIRIVRALPVDEEFGVVFRSYYYVRVELIAQNLFDDLQMEQVYHNLLETFRTHNQTWGAANILWCLGDFLMEMGRADEAESYFRQSRDEFLQIGDRWLSAWSSYALGNLRFQAEHYTETLQWLDDFLEGCAAVGDRGGIVLGWIFKSVVAHKIQDDKATKFYIAQALRAYLEHGSQFSHLNETLKLLTNIFVSEKRYERAAELSSFQREYAANIQALKARDLANQSLESLAQQLSPEVYRQAVERGKKLQIRTLLEQLLVELTDYSASATQPRAIDALTEREIEVLRLLAAGQSNREIAETLVLAISTVKWYLSEIYSKLGVASRTQAIARAGELNLLT